MSREEGNAAFRKGRWKEAAAAYTRAVGEMPGDPVPLANRAMAWLKLERYQDAASDATLALGLNPPPALAQKARYRRALARRGLGDLSGAKADLEEVLRVDGGNDVARGELEEVIEEEGRKKGISEEGAKTEGVEIPSPTPTPTPTAVGSQPKRTANSSALLDEEIKPRTSFAGLARNRPSYVRSEVGQQAKSSQPAPVPTPSQPQQPQPQPQPQSQPVPPNPTSTAPGAGLTLLRKLSSLPIPQRSTYLQHYPASNIPLIVAPVLDPDELALLLSVLVDCEADWARTVLLGLKATRRWKLNVAMLSRAEKEVGVTLAQRLGVEF